MQKHERVTVRSGLGNKATCLGLRNHLCLHGYIRYITKHVHTRRRLSLPGLLTQHRGKNVHVYIVRRSTTVHSSWIPSGRVLKRHCHAMLYTSALSEPDAHVHQKCRRGTLITDEWGPESRCTGVRYLDNVTTSVPSGSTVTSICMVFFFFKPACHLATLHPFIATPPFCHRDRHHWGSLFSQEHLHLPL